MDLRHYTNPVYESYFADPYVWRCGQEYYAIGTGHMEAAGVVGNGDTPSIFPLLRSSDLIRWRPAQHALIRPDVSLGDTFWAPEIVFAEDRWFLYYSVGHEDRLHHIRVASSADPQGPYRDIAALTNTAECAFAIDPHPFRDDDGRWYLFHARDFLDETDESGRHVRVGTALVVHPLLTMTSLSPTGRTVARARFDWQRFAADRPMYGGVYDWHTLEGPFVIKHDHRYYCFYSGGCWQTNSYGVDYLVSDSVMGPYSDVGAEAGPRILRTRPGVVIGPGHCSLIRSPRPDTLLMAYHAWDAGMTARRMCIDRVSFSPTGPQSSGPTSTEQQLPE